MQFIRNFCFPDFFNHTASSKFFLEYQYQIVNFFQTYSYSMHYVRISFTSVKYFFNSVNFYQSLIEKEIIIQGIKKSLVFKCLKYLGKE